MRSGAKTIAVAVVLLAGAACHGVRGGPHGAENPRRFKDAAEWAARFEDPERDTWQRPDHVVSLVGLTDGMKIADIGSATGYFPVRFARACPTCRVYGVDIEPDMVRYLNERVAKAGLSNVESLVCDADDPKLPEPVDVIFLCNTYHHITDRVAYFARCKRLLRPGGRVVDVDFVKRALPIGPPPAHKLAADVVIDELTRAGYRLVRRDETLPYQYILVFEAVD
ncbi:MAG: class I SAM-dependent methyltransferase [Phycisphaerae bacterium]